ncbi:MAG: methyltransferase domain-containing protein [Ornithinibacter sp.]
MLEPYRAVAPIYDLVSGEWPVYRAGRVAGIESLELRPGDTVLDVGCGTGLSFPLLAQAVGPAGHVIGVDASPQMLAVAQRRTKRLDTGVTLLCADATSGRDPAWAAAEALHPDAVLFTYSLSLMKPWRQAWQVVGSVADPQARVVVVDMAIPDGWATVFSPLAKAACWLGRADIRAHPWRGVEEEYDRVLHQRLRGGHIRVVTGYPEVDTPIE